MVTLAELRFGIEVLSKGDSRRDELNEWLSHEIRPMFEQRVLPITEDVMLRWRLLVDEGRKTGHTYSQPDLIIAATALHHGFTVVSRDRSDFDRAGVPVFGSVDRLIKFAGAKSDPTAMQVNSTYALPLRRHQLHDQRGSNAHHPGNPERNLP